VMRIEFNIRSCLFLPFIDVSCLEVRGYIRLFR